MGHCIAPDPCTKRFDDYIAGIPRKSKCVDNVLLCDSNVEEAFWHAYDLLEVCEKQWCNTESQLISFFSKEMLIL